MNQPDLDQLERMQKKLEFQPNKQYLPLVWPPDVSRADGDEVICVNCGESYIQAHSAAGQPHRFCRRGCEVSFWKIESYRD